MLASHRGKAPLRVLPLRFRQMAPFLTLPSLNTFVVGAGDLGFDREEPIYTWEFGPRTSTVTHLDLADMKFDRVKYDEFFGGIKALQSFMIGGGPLNLVVNSLLKYHKDSLEVLQLDVVSRRFNPWQALQYGKDSISSLCEFQVLRLANLDFEHLMEVPKGMKGKLNGKWDAWSTSSIFCHYLLSISSFQEELAGNVPQIF